MATDRPVLERATEINEIEHRCDSITQQILKRLHRTFVTPLDREDIHALALALDDVVDAIDDAALLLRLYHIEEVRRGTRELARIITAQAEQVVAGDAGAREAHEDVPARTLIINRLEHDADGIHRDAVESLFEHERDPIAGDQVEGNLRHASRRRPIGARTSPTSSTASSSSTPEIMDSQLLVVILLVGLALAFDYINGFHDAANSIATVVSTRVLSPGQAVAWAAFFNFVAAFGFGTAVAKTVGSGMVDLSVVSFAVIGAGPVGRDRLGSDHAGTSGCRPARRTRWSADTPARRWPRPASAR